MLGTPDHTEAPTPIDQHWLKAVFDAVNERDPHLLRKAIKDVEEASA